MSETAGLDPHRAAEVITTAAGIRGRRGSGYLVTDRLVLTAAHVLHDAASIRVRFDADLKSEWSATAQLAWSDAHLDVALLRITQATITPPRAARVEPVRFGRIVRPPVDCEALGFPLFKLRDDPARPGPGGDASQYRDSEHATGIATSWSNRREGTMAVKVAVPPRDPDSRRSPWEGMSGAAVFSGSSLIGVIGEHHRSDGLGVLAAYRVDHWYEQLTPEQITELNTLIGLPATAEQLDHVASRGSAPTGALVTPEVGAAATESYLAWAVAVNDRLPVTGLAASRGALDVALERVYVGLKVDSSSSTERAAARENLWREMNTELSALDLSAEEEQQYRWVLVSDLPAADYFGISAWLERYQASGPEVLNIGQLYRRDNATVILGDPGSGKTTIMRWLALVHAKALRDGEPSVRVPADVIDVAFEGGGDAFDLGRPLLPILVRIAEYAADRQACPPGQAPRTLLEFLGHHSWNRRRPVWLRDVAGYRKGMTIPSEILSHLFHTALQERSALIVLDGLDEVPAKERIAIADAVTEFINTWVRDVPPGAVSNKAIVTSRINGYHLAPLPADLTQVTIEGMTDAALQVFVRNWLTEVLTGLARQTAATLPDPLAIEAAAQELLGLLSRPENRYVRDLATNPLLAGVIVSVFLNKGNTLPSQRVEVYQSAVDTLIGVWSRRLSGTYDQGEASAVFEALPAVAAHVHETKVNGVVRAAEFRELLLAEVARLGNAEPDRPDPKLRAAVDSLLQIMAVDLGLLVESGPEAFRFAHQSFQEFLAAQHLIADPAQSATRILARLGDPRWREPILMAIGLVNWQRPGSMTTLADDLLAQRGPLAELFPETALLLAAAVPQMTEVPSQVVRRTARHLVGSYSLLTRGQRLPQVRELLESALSTLRNGDYTAEVDAVMTTALLRPTDDDPAIACATALLIRNLDAASPQLAVALAEAAATWDRDELGSPITETLGLMVSPAKIQKDVIPVPRLAPTWGTGILGMRETLRGQPDLVERIRRSPQWLSLMLTLYGGCWNLGAAHGNDEYERMAGYLQLDDFPRSAFEIAFVQRWGHEDPIYSMAVYLDTEGLEIKRRLSASPLFLPDAITRDSPFTWQVTQALYDDDLPALAAFLRTRLDSDDAAQRAEALLALWALGHSVDDALRDQSPASELAARRIAALTPGLRDAAVRAVRMVAPALVDGAATLAAEDWEFLAAALTRILQYAGAEPISLFANVRELPERHRIRALTEELVQRINGWGDGPDAQAIAFADAVIGSGYPAEDLLAAFNAQGTAWNNGYRRYANWWPSDPLTFPHFAEADIPIAVLDQLIHLPNAMAFFFDWAINEMLTPALERAPQLRPEVLAVAWAYLQGGHTAERSRTMTALDGRLAAEPQPIQYLRGLAAALTDPWPRARALLRIAELYPDHRPEVLQEVTRSIVHVFDPLHSFQLRERLALLAPAREAARHLADCRTLATLIPDAGTRARALLRVARMAGPEQVDAQVQEAIEGIRQVESRAEQLELLRIARELFVDSEACQSAIERMQIETNASETEAAHVSGRWGTVISTHLATLCRDDEMLAQALTPVALYARATDLIRSNRQDHGEQAWRALRAHPSAEAIGAVLDLQAEPVIHCTVPVARSLTAALPCVDVESLAPMLSRLIHMEYGAEQCVRSWLAHPAPRLRRTAALLLAEHSGLSAETATPISELLLTEDDLQQIRARNCIAPAWGELRTSVTRVGVEGVEQLARFSLDHRWTDPGAALAFTWRTETLLHDDPAALSAWCDHAELENDARTPISRILEHIEWATEPVWEVLLDRLRHGSPMLQARILQSCSRMLYRSSANSSEWGETGAQARIRVGPERWAQLYKVLRAIDPEPLRAVRSLAAQVEDVLDAAGDALAVTEGALDAEAGARASRLLWVRAGTSLGAILGRTGEPDVRKGLYEVGESHTAQRDNTARAVAALQYHGLQPPRSEWPWTGLLTAWAADLLATSPQDEPGCWERSFVLEVLAAAAETNPDTFRQHPDAETLGRLLAHAALHHNGFPGRAAAAQLLGLLRHGSPLILDALRHAMHDTAPAVQRAALEAIPRLRSVDRSLVDGLVGSLTDPSVTTAWAAGELLGRIGENATTPKPVRDKIILALAQAAQDPRSRRTVHFSFTDAAIPQMPELDNVFTEALRRVYRLG